MSRDIGFTIFNRRDVVDLSSPQGGGDGKKTVTVLDGKVKKQN